MLCWPNRSSPDSRWPSRRTRLSAICAVALAALLAVAILAPLRVARGQPGAPSPAPRVVLVRMAPCCPQRACPQAEAMLADELDATALDLETVDGELAGDDGAGGRLAARLDGRSGAALRLYRDADLPGCALEMWAQGSGASEAIYRKIRLPEATDRESATNAAIVAAEAVFAGLLELKLVSEEMLRGGAAGTAPTEADEDAGAAGDEADAGVSAGAERTAPAEPNPPPRDRRLGFGLGAGVVWSPGGIGPRGAVRLAFDARVVPWLTLRADGWVTVLGADLEVRDARATFDAATFRLGAFYEFVRRGPLRPALGISGGGVVVWTTGVGAVEYVGDQETALTGYLGGAGRLGIVVGRWFRLEVGAAIGATMPEVRVRFAGEGIASFGRPMIEAFAQVELSFF